MTSDNARTTNLNSEDRRPVLHEVYSSTTRTARLLSGLPLELESTHRQDRRERETRRDEDATERVRLGKKPYFINVSAEGKPYGLGVTVWNDALAKIVRGLDPSYIDIRQQPFHLMEILMKRLQEDFEYSDELNTTWLRTRVGNALSSYRHELIRLIQTNQDRPMWVSKRIWEKLVKLAGLEKFRIKSEQMRYANSCRRNKGRTGPLGEAGITERLRRQLLRSPTLDEVHEEMQRDKGYSGRSRKVPLSVYSRAAGDVEEGEIHGETPNENPSSNSSFPDNRAECPRIGNVSGNVSPISTPSADLPVTATSSHLQSVEVVASPIEDIILKQILESTRSPVGESADGKALIHTLQSQLDALRQRTVATSVQNCPATGAAAVDFQPSEDVQSMPVENDTLHEVTIAHVKFVADSSPTSW